MGFAQKLISLLAVPAELRCALIAASGVLSFVSLPANAFTITSDNSNKLLNELLGNTTGLSNFTFSTTGNEKAFGLFSDDPFNLGQGVVLSTGKVVNLPGINTISQGGSNLSTMFGAPGSPDIIGSQDLAQIDIEFDADRTVNKLFFQYVFGSEEFKEYAGSRFNDAFQLVLNGVNLAKLTNGDTATVNNLVASPAGPFSPDYIDNSVGLGVNTKLDGYTKVLGFEGLLLKNARNTLSIKVADVGDSIFDSAVFIKGKSITTNPKSVPESTPVISLMLIGLLTAVLKRK